ncbi:MAG: TraB/GumN family protein [bacterium]
MSSLGLNGCGPQPSDGVTARAQIEVPAVIKGAPGQSAPALWQITDEDTTLYLFGSIHFLMPDTIWQTPLIKEKFEMADIVYFEVDMTMEEQLKAAPLQKKWGTLAAGKSLKDFYTDKELKEINDFALSLNLPPAMFTPLRPWVVFSTLSIYQIMSVGADPSKGVDMILTNKAIDAGKERRFFATWEEQIRILADLPDEAAAEVLLLAAREGKDTPELFIEMLEDWRLGYAEKLAALMTKDQEKLEHGALFLDQLLYQRNANWAEELSRVLREEEGIIFVAVGAGHLAGEKSVQDYMLQYGYEAIRLQ